MYRKAVFLFFGYEKLLSSGLNNDAPNHILFFAAGVNLQMLDETFQHSYY